MFKILRHQFEFFFSSLSLAKMKVRHYLIHSSLLSYLRTYSKHFKTFPVLVVLQGAVKCINLHRIEKIFHKFAVIFLILISRKNT